MSHNRFHVGNDCMDNRGKLILVSASPTNGEPRHLTATGLLESGLVGLWNDRDDLTGSPEFARQLREQAQRRDLTVGHHEVSTDGAAASN